MESTQLPATVTVLNHTDETPMQPALSRRSYDAIAAYLTFVLLASLAGNGTVLFLYARCKSLRTVSNLFLLNVCVSDVSVAVFGTSFSLASSAAGYWLFGDIGCVWYALISSFCGCGQIVGIAIVSLQRFFMVVKPLAARRLTSAGALGCIGIGWLYSLVAALPPAFGWSEFTYETSGISCSVNWQFGARSYTFFIFTMILAIPFCVIISSYGGILRTVKEMASKFSTNKRRAQEADKKVTIMVLVMVMAFLVAWGPYAVLAMYSVFGDASSLSPQLATFPPMFAKASTAYNPVIYFLLHDKFRAALFRLLNITPPAERAMKYKTCARTAIKTDCQGR